jgi:hypothetical protein
MPIEQRVCRVALHSFYGSDCRNCEEKLESGKGFAFRPSTGSSQSIGGTSEGVRIDAVDG